MTDINDMDAPSHGEDDVSDGAYEYAQEAEGQGSGEEDSRESPFKEGQPLKFVRVRFPGNARSFPFLIGRRKFSYGQKVVAMSDRGMAVGYINSFPYEAPFRPEMMPIRSISKLATAEDIQKQLGHYQKEKEAERVCLRLVERYKLDMNITHVEFTQFGKKAVFYFVAPSRIDFRNLVKDLVGELKMRIELRQISVRDRAAAVGGIGPCGLQLCCSSFLARLGSVNIKMAKNQNLTLIPSKLNGVCGQLKCCVRYEDDVYADKRKALPEEGQIIKIKTGEIGRVLNLLVLEEQFEMLTDRGIVRKYSVSQYDQERPLPENYRFPEHFEHISYETQVVHGKEEYENKRVQEFRENVTTTFPEDRTLAYQYFNLLRPDEIAESLEKNKPFYLDEKFVAPRAQVIYDKETEAHGLDWHEYEERPLNPHELEQDETAEQAMQSTRANASQAHRNEDEDDYDDDEGDEEEEMLAETDSLIKDAQKMLNETVQIKSWSYQDDKGPDTSGDFRSSAGKRDQRPGQNRGPRNRNDFPRRPQGGGQGNNRNRR